MSHFQLFLMILKFSMGLFLSFYTDLNWPFFQVNGTMAHGPLPSQSLHVLKIIDVSKTRLANTAIKDNKPCVLYFQFLRTAQNSCSIALQCKYAMRFY